MSLAQATAFTLAAEGRFTIDNGGPTMYGVTQTVYDAYRFRNSEPKQSVRVILPEEVADIMEAEYWNPAHCGELTTMMGVAHFDWSYNHGVAGAVKTLQQAVGVMDDGVFGPKTRGAVVAAGDSVLQKYLGLRREWYRNAAQVNPKEYGSSLHGWLNRVDNLEKYLETIQND